MIDATIIALLVLNLLFSAWMLRLLTLEVHKAVAHLDTMLAATIQNLIEKGIGDFEPVNPIQAAIAQMLTQNLGKNTGITSGSVIDVELPRSADGKFS